MSIVGVDVPVLFILESVSTIPRVMSAIFFRTVSRSEVTETELNLFHTLYSVSNALFPQIFPRIFTLFLNIVLAVEKSMYPRVSLHAYPVKLWDPGM